MPRRSGPHNAIGTVLYNCGNTRFRINPAHRIFSAGWGREGCNPSCQNNESNKSCRYGDVNKANNLKNRALSYIPDTSLLRFAEQYSFIPAFKKLKNSSEIPGGSLDFFLELLELLLGSLAARSRLLRELFCLGLLRFVQLLQLFLTRWQTVTSLRLSFSFL